MGSLRSTEGAEAPPAHLHTGEVAAMRPGEPATGGALVDVHVLQVHVHADDAAAEDREEDKAGGFK